MITVLIGTRKVDKTHSLYFLGSSAADHLWPLVQKNDDIEFIKDKCDLERWDRQIGRFWGRVGHLEYDDVCTDITFIRHPSAFFQKINGMNI